MHAPRSFGLERADIFFCPLKVRTMDGTLNILYCYIKDEGGFWGSIIAGLLALTAGWIAYRAGQIQAQATRDASLEQSRWEADRLDRRHAAARAVLPLALSASVEYAESCALSLEEFRVSMLPSRAIKLQMSYEPPSLDPSAIHTMQQVIESTQPIIGERIAELISKVQVLASNLRIIGQAHPLGGAVVRTNLNIEDAILKAAEIFARGEDLFAYARQDSDEPPPAVPSQAGLTKALNSIGFNEATHPKLYEMAIRRAARWAEDDPDL